jgi:hypothetical protein
VLFDGISALLRQIEVVLARTLAVGMPDDFHPQARVLLQDLDGLVQRRLRRPADRRLVVVELDPRDHAHEVLHGGR